MSELATLISDSAVTANPYATYRRLRDEAPVLWVEQLSSWAVSRYDDVATILEDPGAFSSAGRVKRDLVSADVWTAFGGFDGFFWSDPPAYTEHRDVWTRAFKPRLKGIPSIVARVVGELLDDVDPSEPFDAVSALAFPLPATVILELLGIPRTDRELFRRVSGILIGGGDDAADAIDEAAEWLIGFLEERQRRPADDVLSDVLIAREPVGEMDPRLLRAEIVDIVQFLLAGHETTTSSIASGLVQLLERPSDRKRFLEDRRIRMSTVEEILRFESPLQFIERRAARDATIHGQRIEADSMIRLLLGSANHDERRFEDAEAFRIDRAPNPHLAFGHGIHVCLGAPLARIEIPIALESTLRRHPDLVLAVDPEAIRWRTNFMFHAIEELPLRAGAVR
jgi:cytochrome P450